MNSDCLQRLVMDRALDELSPDTAELLEAYLEDRPETSLEVREIEDTLSLARQVIRGPQRAAAELPPLKLDRVILNRRGRRARWVGVLGMAACLMLGFWLGRGGPILPTTAQSSNIGGAEQTAEDFWSVRRLSARPATEDSTGHVHWSSPSAWPQLGDRS